MNVTIIADASFCHRSRAAGYGFWIASYRGKLGGGGYIKRQLDNSNAAEMAAIVNALYKAIQAGLVRQTDSVLFQTDCQAAIDAFNGMRSRLSPDEITAMGKFAELSEQSRIEYEFRHVKGHTSRSEARFVTNNLCDSRAKAGMQQARLMFEKTSGQLP